MQLDAAREREACDSPRTRRAVIVGDSHTQALIEALQLEPDASARFAAYRLARKKEGHVIPGVSLDDMRGIVANLNKDDLVVTAMGGSLHLKYGLVQHPQRFDILLDANDTCDPEAQIIPRRQIEDMFDAELQTRVRPKLAAIKSWASGQVVQLAYPAPKCDLEFLRGHLGSFQERFEAYGLSHPKLVRKIWRILNERLELLCQSAGISFLPVPAKSLTEHGFLAPHYYAGDASHANASYGSLLFDQLNGLLEQRGSLP